MVASKPKILKSQFSDEIETKLQWLKLCVRGPAFELHWWEYISTKRNVEKPIWWPENRQCLATHARNAPVVLDSDHTS